jgi:drug/metabolite transporter (DMT)-like permease
LSVRVSPISKTAALLIIAVGAFVLLAGLTTGEATSDLAGIVFIALGLFLYGFLLRFTRKLERELSEVQKG